MLCAHRRRRRRWPPPCAGGWAGLAILVLLAVGVALRLAPATGFSDVLVVSQAATRELLAGGNPYGHGFSESVPPGAPFAYGPLALLWYLPSLDRPGQHGAAGVDAGPRRAGPARPPARPGHLRRDPGLRGRGQRRLQRHDGRPAHPGGPAGGAALARRGRRPAGRWPRPSSPMPWPGCPGCIGYAGGVGAPGGLRAGLGRWPGCRPSWPGVRTRCCGPSAAPTRCMPSRTTRWPTAWAAPSPCRRAAWQALRVGVGVLLAVLSLRLVRSAPSFVIVGALIFGATLFLGFWSTFAYLAAVAPVLCWHLDDWLGLGGGARRLARRSGACSHHGWSMHAGPCDGSGPWRQAPVCARALRLEASEHHWQRAVRCAVRRSPCPRSGSACSSSPMRPTT